MKAFKRLFGYLLVGVVLLLPQAVIAAPGEIFRYTLDNGMDVVVISDHRTPVVVHMVWYKVGAADEPWGKSGIAHVLEHMMFRGTKAVPPGELSKIVARNGGRDNAFTSSDYTGYYQMVAKDRLPLVMELEADRMVNLQLTEELFEPELKVVVEERNSRIDNQPGSLLGERMTAIQYLQHPYRNPLIGWPQELRSLTRDDAQAFYDRYYTPSNAVLVVAGDVTGPEVKALAEEHYGDIEARPVAARFRPQEPPQLAPRRVTLNHPDVTQPVWRRSYIAPSARRGDTELSPGLEVLAQYLGGGILSRLYQSLVVEQKIAAGTAAWYSAVQRDLTTFGIYASPVPGADLSELEAAVETEINAVAAGDIDPADVERAKTLLKADVIYARDNIRSMARIYGTVLSVGLTTDYIENWSEVIDKVTPEDVAAAAKAVLVPEGSVTGILLPEEATAGDGDGGEVIEP